MAKFIIIGLRRLLVLAVLAILGVLLIGSAGVATWKYTNSNHFCSTA